MSDFLSRTRGLIGSEKLDIIQNSSVLLVGLGGVGSYCGEALVRAGLGELTVIDFDIIDITNINRQLIATVDTIGEYKVDVFEKRAKLINPDIRIKTIRDFYDADMVLDYISFDYVVDCIDSIKSKLLLIENAKKYDRKIISAMGAGNKLNPSKFKISNITKTNTCPLAKIIRKELKKRGINELKVCWSDEKPYSHDEFSSEPKSISFVPSVVGLLMAGEIIIDLMGD